jgi:hypothetical protein
VDYDTEMNLHSPQIVKLTIEYNALSKNPAIRTMFTDNSVGSEIDGFVRKHHLLLELIRKPSGNCDGFALSGEINAVGKFLQKYLSQDGESGGYMLNVNEA